METKALAPRKASHRLEFTCQYFKRDDSGLAATSVTPLLPRFGSNLVEKKMWKPSTPTPPLRDAFACLYLCFARVYERAE